MTRRRVVALGCAAALTVLAASGPAGADRGWESHLQSAATAVPAGPAGTAVHATAWRNERTRAHDVRADGVATTSLSCDGCSGDATTLQIVRAPRAHAVTGDNVAVAWASGCTGCGGWALSIQLIIAGTGSTLAVGNRALAVNAACSTCSVTAVAVQIVLVAANERQLSQHATDQLLALRAELIAQLTAPHPAPTAPTGRPSRAYPQGRAAPAAPPMTTTVSRMQAVAAADLQASSARHDVQVRTS